jgi:hypothetical protein
MLLVGFGLLLMGGLDAHSGWTHLLPGFLCAGFGVGMINPPLATTQVGVVPPERSGMASGIGNTFRQVGISTGIAGLGAIFEHAVTQRTLHALGGKLPGGGDVSAALSSGNIGPILRSLPPDQRARFVEAFHTGFTGALNDVLLIGALVALWGALAGFLLIRREDFVGAPAPEAAPVPA